MRRDTYVRIGEAARFLGKSVDTLRRWEAEGRLLPAPRSIGGQRTYLLAEIQRLLDDDDEDGHASGDAPQVTSPRPRPAHGPVSPRKVREANAAADLSVTRLRNDRREEVRHSREAEQRRLDIERAEPENRAAAARLHAEQTAKRNRQQQELDGCLESIRIGLIWEPSAVRAEVERFLADHATLGVSIPWLEAEATAIIDRHRAEREAAGKRESEAESKRLQAEAQEAADQRRRNALLRHGVSFVNELTADREEWDAEDAEQAVEEVREHLADVVEPTWSKKRVEREVADVLEEWE
jgi:predicted DNA-binding transcriptional regulator AlpA